MSTTGELLAETHDPGLSGIAHYAPRVPSDYSLYEVDYNLSNDNLATTFEQLEARKCSPTFQAEPHPTALLIGESSLMSSIRFMPESTILMVDMSYRMVSYMRHYVTALRESRNIGQWLDAMNSSDVLVKTTTGAVLDMPSLMVEWAKTWAQAGISHPATSDHAFEEASELARAKTIVPWHADITELRDTRRLGKVLRAYGAGVTLMNLTNALVTDTWIQDARDVAEPFAALPVTTDAPIITTTLVDHAVPQHFPLTQPAGLFFGVDDLTSRGGNVRFQCPPYGPAAAKTVRS